MKIIAAQRNVPVLMGLLSLALAGLPFPRATATVARSQPVPVTLVLEWGGDRALHRGVLRLLGDQGTLRTEYVNPRTGRVEAVDQMMQVVREAEVLRVVGSRPVVAGTSTPHPHYAPDTFFFVPVAGGSVQVTLSDAAGVSLPVAIVGDQTTGPGSGSAAPPQQQGLLVLQAVEVLELRLLQGQQAWSARARQGMLQATWAFFPDGTFIYERPDLCQDLFPLRGRYQQIAEGVLAFERRGSSRTGSSGSANVEVHGQVDLRGSTPVVSITQATTSGAAATIYGVPYAHSNAFTYEVRLIALRR